MRRNDGLVSNSKRGSMPMPSTPSAFSYAVEGLKANSVSVVDTAGNVLATEDRSNRLDFAQATATNSVVSTRQSVATVIQDARLLIELGKLDEAAAKLEQVSKQEPDHPAPQYYLDLIDNMRRAREARHREVQSNDKVQIPIRPYELPQPSPFARNLNHQPGAGKDSAKAGFDCLGW